VFVSVVTSEFSFWKIADIYCKLLSVGSRHIADDITHAEDNWLSVVRF
jgi:hypothetical protein